MPFPETTDELVKAGYQFLDDACCSKCGERIEWWQTPRGKKMPMEVDGDGNCESHWANCPNAQDFRK